MTFTETDILITAVTIMGTTLGYIIKVNADQAIKKLEEIVSELKQQRQLTTIHDQEIKYLREQTSVQDKRLNDHTKRIREIELHTHTPSPNHIET